MDTKLISRRLTAIRADMLRTYPFFGRLLLRLRFGFADCGTAFTDMRRIVFDPDFAERLSDDELGFVLLHEVMHCVLKHCVRGRNLIQSLYNLACDIVVNSLILETLGVEDFTVDGEQVVHTTPDGDEGRSYSAEEVYRMLLESAGDSDENYFFDLHLIWSGITDTDMLDDKWEQNIIEASAVYGSGSGIPDAMQRYLKEITHNPKTNWRQLLHDFLQHDICDYSYLSPDKRFSGDIIMPSFREYADGTSVDRLWFFIDTSGSVSEGALSEAYYEIGQALEQIDSLSGMISFFDSQVSDPIPFDSAEALSDIAPIGGGGTSFHAIFRYVGEIYEGEPPRLIIIITDGYAPVPDESAANGIPVLWLIINSDITPDWGQVVHIDA